MRRRRFLTTAVTAGSVGLAGCGTDGQTDPEPAASELRISVENDDDRTQSVAFVLQTTSDDLGVVRGFDSGEIVPGATWTREPETLEVGTYDLTIEMPILNTESTLGWAGNECPTKAIDIELRTDGFRIRDSCPE